MFILILKIIALIASIFFTILLALGCTLMVWVLL
jgi:hypothetical protein